jgi:5-methylcytosine-specific restriction endonuclease McrA
MTKSVGVGALFPKDAHSRFFELTSSRYEGMRKRLDKKKIALPFTLSEFRADVLSALNGKEDGAVQCRYCKGCFPLEDAAVDHATPLSRGGGAELGNLDYPCKPCNDQKGSMKPAEFLALLKFLETAIPLARQDVLSRLSKAIALAAAMRNNAGVVGELKKTGEWQKVSAARRAKKKQAAMSPF